MATTNNADIKTLKDFYQTISTKGVRTAHMFSLQFGANGTGPGASSINRLQNSNFIVYAESANLPGRTIENQPLPFYGFSFQIPVNTAYTQTWTANVRCDTNVEIRDIFETWMNDIADLRKSTGGSKGRVPTGTYGLIHLLSPSFFNSDGSTGDIVRTYRLEGIFPQSLGDMEHTHASSNITSFQTTFTFQYWYVEGSVLSTDTTNPLG
jgi:hypothetical protein